MRVRLSNTEVRLGKHLGSVIHKARINSGSKEEKRTSHTDGETIHQLGVLAEIAVAKALNLYPDLEVYEDKPGPAYDLMINGIRIDVKYLAKPDGNLLVTVNKAKTDVDAYVMVSGEVPEFEIVGWAGKREVAQCPVVNFGNGDSYKYPRYCLRDINELTRMYS